MTKKMSSPISGAALSVCCLLSSALVSEIAFAASALDLGEKGLAYQALAVETAPDAAFLGGRIVNEAGQPIVGAKVDAFHWFPGSETTTDATGAFRLANTNPKEIYLQAGEKIEVTFSAPGYTPRYIVVQPLGQIAQPVVLNQKTFLEGTVRAPDGKPVAGAQVRAVAGPFQGDGVRITEVPYLTKSDAQGHFKLFLQADHYELFVLGAQGVSRTPEVVLTPDKALEKNFALHPGATFQARVVDSVTGKPVGNFRLRSRGDFSAQSDQNGNIEIRNMYSGPFEWDVEAPGIVRWWSENATREHQRKAIEEDRGGWQRNFDNLEFRIADNMAPVTIVAERGVRISGRVLDPQGKPVAGATVDPALTGTGNSLTGDTRFSCRTNAKGEYSALLPAGHERQWNLTAHDGDYGEWRSFANATAPPLRTTAGQIIKNYDLTLQAPVTVSGHVVGKDGQPIAGAEVRAVPGDKCGNRYYDPTVKTDAKGDFTLRFVAPGRHFVQVEPFWLSAQEAPTGSTASVAVEAGAPVSGVQLTQVPIR